MPNHLVRLATLALVLALARSEPVAVAQDGTSATGVKSISHYNINYRQEQTVLPVSASTSSYDYWWPYPPGGVVTSTSVPTLSFTLPSSTIISDNIISTTSTDEDTSVSTSSTESPASTSIPETSSSTTIFHITALPAANSSAPNTSVHKLKANPPGAFKITYLEPMFAIIGIALGSSVAWFCFGCISARRGPRTRASSLEPGPAYVATIGDDDEKYECGHRDMEAAAAGSPSKHSRHGSSYGDARRSRLWLARAMSAHAGDPVGGTAFSWPAPAPTPGGYEHEGDPFLAVPSQAKAAPGKSMFPSSWPSPDPLALIELDEGEEVPFESLRHTSIRRGILERLKFGTVRRGQAEGGSEPGRVGWRLSTRRGHSRAESDVRVDEVKFPERKDEREWVAGSGFRIVEEDLEAIREKIRGGDWGDEEGDVGRHNDFSSAGVMGKEGDITWDGSSEDKYTAMPVRKSPSKKGSGPPAGMPRVDSRVLPASPRQITSPPLEWSLCFRRVGSCEDDSAAKEEELR